MEQDQASALMRDLLNRLVASGGSDLFITAGFAPALKVDGEIASVTPKPLSMEHATLMVRSLMNEQQVAEFEATQECNFAIQARGVGRFRVSAFVQRGSAGAVLRVINTNIPTLQELELPQTLADLVMQKRGLILMVGATGSGKSTSMAAMLGVRNQHSHGHIVTIEDPIEYMHSHGGCIVTQRELGVDTESWGVALKNTLRQAPDVILIGEIRERETMEYAIQFCETGHLCLATLHANSSNQALDRIINFFPEERRSQLLMDISLNLRCIISQRLLRRKSGEGRTPAMEIMLNTPLISDLIFKGEVAGIKEVMSRSTEAGMETFDQCLFRLFEAGRIDYEEALRHADSQNELRLRIKLESQRAPASLLDSDEVKGLSLAKEGGGDSPGARGGPGRL
jgi:twitching motility protein PilU